MVAEWWIRLGHRLRTILHGNEEDGQGLVEYAMILAFIAIVVVIALKFLQPNISSTLNQVTNSF